ncbi:MAG: N-formylglutamate amidohydrolase [Alphaproteobacteria bacterium]
MGAESQVVRLIEGASDAPFLFVCEHASNHIPTEFEQLGISDEVAVSHIAWDVGGDAITRQLADTFNSPAVLSNISRLVYDCNRPPEAVDSMPEKSEIFTVPGNLGLSGDQRAERVKKYYSPFKQQVADALASFDVEPVLVTIHTFTPVYKSKKRDVRLGILHDDDTRFADCMLNAAANQGVAGTQRNQPYGPADGVTHTLKVHGISNGLANVMIEIRNDLTRTDEQCREQAHMLESLLSAALKEFRQEQLAEVGHP